MKPIIGVLPLWDDEKESIWILPGYMNTIREAGGLPILLPLVASHEDIEQICGVCSGFLLTGGDDVNPKLYNEQKSELCGKPNDQRDWLESEVFHFAIKRDLPILGICRGIQFINAICGGTLYQDLPSQHKSEVNHQMKPPYDRACHRVTILKDTPLHSILKSEEVEPFEIGVNSYHHQAIKDLAPQLKAQALSEDGLIEAIYMPTKRFVQALQWHPEFNFYCDINSRKIIESFIQACD